MDTEETKRCSNCKRDIIVASFLLHEVHCKRNLKLCDMCGNPVPKSEIEQHYLEEHAPEPCDLCGEKLPKDGLDAHKDAACPKVRVECKYCELEIPRAEYTEHKNGCGSRTDFCELCNQRVMLKDMEEHKQAKCGHLKSEDAMSSYALRQMGFEEGEGDVDDINQVQDEVLSGGNYQNRPSLIFPRHSRHSTSPTPSSPPEYGTHKDSSICVDPQWLASVQNACGKDFLDQLLEQNLRAVENFGGGGSASSSSSDSENDPGDFRSDNKCNEDGLNQGHNQGLPAPSEVSNDPDNYYRRTLPGPQGGMNQEELEKVETEKKDAEFAMMIHERENAYSRINGSSEGLSASASKPNMKESDVEMARRIHERDIAYAQRNQRFEREESGAGRVMHSGSEECESETTEWAFPNPGMTYTQIEREDNTRKSAGKDKPELARVHRRGAIRSQDNRREGSTGEKSTEESDAEVARHIHERDLAYATRNGSYEDRDTSGWVDSEDTFEGNHKLGMSRYDERDVDTWEGQDAMLARKIAQRERDYEKKIEADRILAKQLQESDERAYSNAENDLEVARRIQMEQEDVPSSSFYGHMGYNHEVLMNEQPRAKTPARELESPQDEGAVPCQYCYNLFPFKMIMEHQQICRSEQYRSESGGSRQSEDVYSRIRPNGPRREVVLTEEAVQVISKDAERGLYGLQGSETAVCEYCNATMLMDNLRVHQVTCESNPNSQLRNAYSPATPRREPEESRFAIPTQHDQTPAVDATNLNEIKGPCEICGKLIPVAILVKHETTCRHPQSTSQVPAIAGRTAPREVIHGSVHGETNTTAAAGLATATSSNPKTKRNLAIRFPGQDSPNSTNHPSLPLPPPYVLPSSAISPLINPSLRTNHHQPHQLSHGTSMMTTKQPPKSLSSSRQSQLPRTDQHKPNATIKCQEEAEERGGLYGDNRRRIMAPSRAKEPLVVVGKSAGTESMITTIPAAAATGIATTRKTSRPPKGTAVSESSGSIPFLPEVVSVRQPLHQPVEMGRGSGRVARGDGVRLPHVVGREVNSNGSGFLYGRKLPHSGSHRSRNGLVDDRKK